MVNSDTDPIQELHTHLALLMTVIEKGFQRVYAGQKKTLDGVIELHGEALAIRHTTDAMISADDVRLVIVQAVQELAAGNMALASPGHPPTEQDNQQIMQMIQQIVREVTHIGRRLDLLEKVTLSNSTPSVLQSTQGTIGDDRAKNTPEKSGSRGRATPAFKASVGQGTVGDDLGDGKRSTPKVTPAKTGDDLGDGQGTGDVRGRVIDYYLAHPTLSLQAIATAVGTNKSYVGRIVTDLKKQKTGKK
jgi:hypothetical protein